MGCVDSSKFFCAFLETLVDVENALVDTEIFVLTYGDIAKTLTPPTGWLMPTKIGRASWALATQ